MGVLFRLIEVLLLLLPLAGLIVAGVKAVSSLGRRAQQQTENAAASEVREVPPVNQAARWQAIRRAIDAHEQTDARWLQYELDAAKLLDFPLMTDLRDPLTAGFHKAKLRADLHKPLRAEDLVDDRDAAATYLEAVQDYVSAFDAAEAEAMRRQRSDFSTEERQRLVRAQNLLRIAADSAATAQERKHAYGLARTELDGLVVLPDVTRDGIERGIAGEIDP
ncbi:MULTISPECIES: hypothetical protein [Mycobacterium]|uniref:Uncharacterized protein n=1 Tax=Mycobacterium kiyosense TaxID=2871094 RepID=A0A9P3Q305_9MYCO|nr:MULTISPECIES: hypothetical protein [Mycobacterium]BDB42667.1 hypothetical protein IWGMT90018_31130 [Mycobacterium kiyosense]BDE14076.1 hypothetical protein MKCMC460_29360 [Mycobacterium sp. 20KCMC460]GLB81168.1 hypothetical protein SRL2020028_04240 [Mycobacterium kiyosense]GLB88198.1 hypothetical protein SRL2020130_10150 [Mycobacterium kiyosense]GLB94504.1 hypothetical protein SRL2020226_12800 [Mycobacterium kiyosense]